MKTVASQLTQKIQNKKAHIAIVGLGYVGLPLAVEFAKRGFSVLGIDTHGKKVSAINRGTSYVEDVPPATVRELVQTSKLKATKDFKALRRADAVIVCVPTPLNRVKDPDLSFVLDATSQIAHYLHRGQLIILESTTYPGTTDEVILPKLESTGLKIDREFFLSFSPERIDPGNKQFPVVSVPKVVGGITPTSTKLAALLYGQIFSTVIPVSSARTAEMAKLLENTFRIVNIGLVNELATVAGSLGVDIWEAIDAAKSKPFGFMPFYPGPGVGGHCIGIDPLYLSWKAKVHGSNIRFIELAREVNTGMPKYVVDRAVRELSRRQKKAINRAKVLVIGVSYKRDVADTRESPAFEILEQLEHLGAEVSYHDPHVPTLTLGKNSFRSRPLTRSEIKRHDAVLIVTNHSAIDYRLIRQSARFVLDARNAMKTFSSKTIVKL